MKEYEMDEACDTVVGDGKSYRILAGKTEGKIPLGRLRRR
jgi:hypothetical protein